MRPARALTWIRRFGKAPPMNRVQTMVKLDLPDEVLRTIHRLIEDKAGVTEACLTVRKAVLDDFLAKTLAGQMLERPDRAVLDQEKLAEANRLFLEIIG